MRVKDYGKYINDIIMEEKLKYLEFIQGVITRMNSNSFSIKTWMITILSAFLALYANSSNELYLLIAACPTLLFWLFDTYYLAMERQYRNLYNEVKDRNDIDFDMKANKYNLCYFATLFRPIEIGVYLPILIAIVAAWYFLR